VVNGRNANRGEPINSLCSEVTLISLKNHNQTLPITVVFINSFIHFSTSNHASKHHYMTGQFYMVFGHFAALGKVARLYLLKNKTLGRLLDIFLHGDIDKN